MQRPWVALVLTLLPLAGCLGAEQDPAGVTDPPVQAPEAPPLPKAIQDSKTVAANSDLVNQGTGGSCFTSGNQCFKYSFDVLASDDANVSHAVNVKAVVRWALDLNDFDLYLLKDATVIAQSNDYPPKSEERIELKLDQAGAYELWVVAFAVAGDTFTLGADFSRPGA